MDSLPIKNGFGAITKSELDRIQQALLDLLTEFDQICRENQITYYLDGGSVIGALRHKGFIPWDDDVDILIKKKDFDRLMPILEKLSSRNENRCFSYTLSKYRHHRSFARYIRTDIPCILTNSVVEAEYLPGIFLDIFILDGVEDKHLSGYRKVLECSEEWFHRRLNGVVGRASIFEYLLATYAEKKIGEKRVAKYYINKIESFEKRSERIDYYIPRNGFNYAVYDADVFQEPVYVEFAGGLFPVPSKPEKYLRAHYSTDWFNMPEPEDRFSHHFMLTSEYFTPKEFQRDYDWFSDQPKLHRVQSKRHFFQVLRKKFVVGRQSALVKLQGLKCDIELEKILPERVSISKLKALEVENKYSVILDFFQPYFDMQKSLFKRYKLARYGISLPDGYLYFALKSLIMTGRFCEANKYIALYEDLDISTKSLAQVLSAILKLEHAMQDREYTLAKQIINTLPKEFLKAPNVVVYRSKLELLYFTDVESEINFYKDVMKNNGLNFDLYKLMADCYYKNSDYLKAAEIYGEIVREHNNGLVVMSASEKLSEIKTKLEAEIG